MLPVSSKYSNIQAETVATSVQITAEHVNKLFAYQITIYRNALINVRPEDWNRIRRS
jgi:hypothetical protein